MKILGVDTGGTFTDFVYLEAGLLRVHKVLSTPHAPEQAILQGIDEMALDLADGLRIIHGSTVATNAVLEGKGARTVYIANHGLSDVLSIGRQARAELYNLQPAPVTPPVPSDLCLETGGRLGADGELLEPLDEETLEALRTRLLELKPQAVAINLLFSFLDDRYEKAIAALVPKAVFVSRSSAVLPEYREYERGIATWLNARVGPVVAAYLHHLEEGISPATVSVMQSSGETVAAAQAALHGVNLLLSGPAGGISGAQYTGLLAGSERLLSFDMGGTSTDVALVDGRLRLTREGRIGPYPVAVPMVDMHTIGAGGGSLARLDAGGLLQVGPESAGADPGPACYGRGGSEPTVTDANLVLGRLRAEVFLGGTMGLDVGAARDAVDSIAGPLSMSTEQAALGILRLANEHMAQALRVISVERGIDPRGMSLCSFGGAGGLHVCALAEALGMQRALVPVHAGVLSALGMLVAPPGRQLSRTLNRALAEVTDAEVQQAFVTLELEGLGQLGEENVASADIRMQRSVDLRYRGQSFALELDWTRVADMAAAFHSAHQQRYGHQLEEAVELVNLRVGLSGPAALVDLEAIRERPPAVPTRVDLHGVRDAGLVARAELAVGQCLDGPLLVTDSVSTTFVAAGWRACLDRWGNLLLDQWISDEKKRG